MVAADRVLSNGQSLESVMNEMIKLKQSAKGMNSDSDTLGSQWLSQRRKMFESTKVVGATKEKTEGKPFVDNDGIDWKTQSSTDISPFETRDDFVASSPMSTLPSGRENVETERRNDTRKNDSGGDIVDVIRSTSAMPSDHVSPIVKSPDPVGERMTQKVAENLELTKDVPDNAITQKNPNESVKDALLELKQEMLRLSQANEKEEIGEKLGDPFYETDDFDDDILLESLPLDLTAICDPAERSNRRERSQCAKTLTSELQKNGHAVVCGTSVSRFICRDALYASHLLLCEIDESVRGSCRSQKESLRGYVPKCTERSNSSGLTDMVRKFRLGSRKGSTRNIWPVGRSLDEETEEYIRSSLEEYHDSLHRVANSITKSLLENFDNDTPLSKSNETVGTAFVENDPNASILTVFNCEQGSRHDTKKPLVANHTDESLLTILLLDGGDCAHVQHEVAERQWKSVKLPQVVPMDPVFIIFAGSNLQKLSANCVPSNPRKIVPTSGQQNVNGLSFSLMPSDGNAKFAKPSIHEEPTDTSVEELSNPISKLASELKSIDEMFQSVVFAEDEDFEYDSDFENQFEEDFHYTMDSAEQNLEDARELRRSHIGSNRLRSKKMRASYPFGGDDVEFSTLRNNSSRRASFGGRIVMDGEDSTIASSRRERYRPKRTERSPQLLGSPILPIVIEGSSRVKAREIIQIDEDFEQIPLPPTNHNVHQRIGLPPRARPMGAEKVNNFLPVAKPAFKPEHRAKSSFEPERKESSHTRTATQKAVTFTAKSSAIEKRSTKPRILYNNDYNGRRFGESTADNTTKMNSAPVNETKNVAANDERLQNLISFLEEHSIQSSDASLVLEELLRDGEDNQKIIDNQVRRAPSKRSNDAITSAPSQAKNSNSVIKAPSKSDVLNAPSSQKYEPLFKEWRESLSTESSKNCDGIFKECRESIASEQSMYKTCEEVQQSLPHPPSSSSLGTLTKNNTLYNQIPSKSNGYGLQGSVEWKKRENVKKIRKSSLKWVERGYRFGCDGAKNENGK